MNNALFQKFGGKRGFLRTLWYSARTIGGGWRAYRAVDWPAVSRLIFVCKGNICRSAFAAGKARTLGLHAVSAGLSADPGQPANHHAQEVARCRDVSLDHHRSRSMLGITLQPGDLLVAFEPEHARSLESFAARQDGVRVTLLGLWHDEAWWAYLHDPYGLPKVYFHCCFERIERALDGLRGRREAAIREAQGENRP